jgi:hypothetical protein
MVDAQHAQPSPHRVNLNAAPAPESKPAVGAAPRSAQSGGPRKETVNHMLTRATTNAVAHRASSMRRMRRRAVAATRLYCSTNGCTSFLVIDEFGGVAHCEICGYSRKLH